MHARRALLKKLASVTVWDESDRDAFTGETSVETRNTIYRFRDGVCFGVTSRGARKADRVSAIVGMRLVGWLVPNEESATTQRLVRTWEPGACAVLFRRCATGEDDGAMALTSATTDFTQGLGSARLQAFHDAAPPSDSAMYRRGAASDDAQANERAVAEARMSPPAWRHSPTRPGRGRI